MTINFCNFFKLQEKFQKETGIRNLIVKVTGLKYV